MERKQPGDSLELEYYEPIDHKIEPVTAVERNSAITDRHWNLMRHLVLPRLELIPETVLISTLQKSWAERGVHLECCIHSIACDQVDVVG